MLFGSKNNQTNVYERTSNQSNQGEFKNCGAMYKINTNSHGFISFISLVYIGGLHHVGYNLKFKKK